jgi:hypothetical protein
MIEEKVLDKLIMQREGLTNKYFLRVWYQVFFKVFFA